MATVTRGQVRLATCRFRPARGKVLGETLGSSNVRYGAGRYFEVSCIGQTVAVVHIGNDDDVTVPWVHDAAKRGFAATVRTFVEASVGLNVAARNMGLTENAAGREDGA